MKWIRLSEKDTCVFVIDTHKAQFYNLVLIRSPCTKNEYSLKDIKDVFMRFPFSPQCTQLFIDTQISVIAYAITSVRLHKYPF